jgi:hypothetical protein
VFVSVTGLDEKYAFLVRTKLTQVHFFAVQRDGYTGGSNVVLWVPVGVT